MKIFLINTLLLVALTGCFAINQPYIWKDERVDVSKAQTFSWIAEHPLGYHQIHTNVSKNLEESLMRNTREILEANGMTYTDNHLDSDLNISFAIGAKTREIRPISNFPPAISGDDSEAFLTRYDLGYDYIEGQLCIEFHDPSTNQPYWHGTIDDIVLPDENVFEDETVQKILTLILAEYPAVAKEHKATME